MIVVLVVMVVVMIVVVVVVVGVICRPHGSPSPILSIHSPRGLNLFGSGTLSLAVSSSDFGESPT